MSTDKVIPAGGEEAKKHAPEIRFHQNVVAFCDYVTEIVELANDENINCPVTPFTMTILKAVVSASDPHKMMQSFINKSQESWDKIYEKNLDYFRSPEGLAVFDKAPKEHVEAFSKLIDYKIIPLKEDGSPDTEKATFLVNEERRESLWKFFHSFVKQSICYIYIQRKPDPVTKKPTISFCPKISIKNLTQKWNIVKLE